MKLDAPVPRNPTHQECTDHVEIAPGAWAFWWPQMGGYGAHAVAVPDPDCCIDVYVWHDGRFPFDGSCQSCGDDRAPTRLHIEDGDAWIRLGEFLNSLDGETS